MSSVDGLTVGNLIQRLSDLDPDMPVLFQDDHGATTHVRDMVDDYLTNLETDEKIVCAILLDYKLSVK